MVRLGEESPVGLQRMPGLGTLPASPSSAGPASLLLDSQVQFQEEKEKAEPTFSHVTVRQVPYLPRVRRGGKLK